MCLKNDEVTVGYTIGTELKTTETSDPPTTNVGEEGLCEKSRRQFRPKSRRLESSLDPGSGSDPNCQPLLLPSHRWRGVPQPKTGLDVCVIEL